MAPRVTDPDQINLPDVVAQVTRVFERYEAALVANDVEVLIELFWDDPRTVRFGIDEQHVGHADIAAYRRTQAMATPPRRLRNTVITTFGTDLATADTEFVPDGSDAVGRQSQTWIRTADGWRVASAHVSWLSGERP
jgi:ketosteroid isomerase-like protein